MFTDVTRNGRLKQRTGIGRTAHRSRKDQHWQRRMCASAQFPNQCHRIIADSKVQQRQAHCRIPAVAGSQRLGSRGGHDVRMTRIGQRGRKSVADVVITVHNQNELRYNRRLGGECMATCPECDIEIEIDEDDLEEMEVGDPWICDGCASNLRIASLDPLEFDVDEDDDEEDDAEESDDTGDDLDDDADADDDGDGDDDWDD